MIGQLEPFRILDFSGGEVSRLANEVMRDNELNLAQNASFKYPGIVVQRDPIVAYSSNSNTETITEMQRWYKSDASTKRFFWASSTRWGTIDDATQTISTVSTGLTANVFCHIVSAQDLAILCNGKDAPRKASDTITTDTLLAGTPPVGNIPLYHIGKLYMGGDPLNPSRWYASAAGNVESWAASDFLNVDSNDGAILLGAMSAGDRQALFKENQIQTLDGDSATNWRLRPSVKGIGLFSPKSLAIANGVGYFLGIQGSRVDLYSYLAGMPQRISQNITDRFDTDLNRANKYQYSGFVNFPWYYLFYQNAAGNLKILQYDIGLNAFITWNAGSYDASTAFIDSMASWPNGSDTGQLFVSQNKAINQISLSATNTTAVKIQTKYYDFGKPEIEKRFWNLFIHPQDITNRTNFTITYDLDFANTYADTVTFDARGKGATVANEWWRYISFQITFSANASKFHGLYGVYETVPLETAR